MSWWNRLQNKPAAPPPVRATHTIQLNLAGWNEEPSKDELRCWRGPHGDVMTLAVLGSFMDFPSLFDAAAWQKWARDLAKSRQGGLIEVRKAGDAIAVIYKQLKRPAYVFTGMLITLTSEASQVWTVVSQEYGRTGVREALITGELFESGTYTIKDYQDSFAHDPYDPSYLGVDRSVLRFVSDDEKYDERFPNHPLTRVRQILAALPESVVLRVI
ncbi:MAG: hypothetical protein ACJ71W_13735 [Terriglobales bacterium]|jgi:hypothetical protein